jgi:ribonuclease P protein component
VKRGERLRKRKDFDLVFKTGRRAGDRVLGIRMRENGLDVTRSGFICGKAVGNAVERNRVKRRLREAFRRAGLPPGVDCVVIARAGAAQATFSELEASLQRLLRKVAAPGAAS